MKNVFLAAMFISLSNGCVMVDEIAVDKGSALRIAVEHIKERWDYDSIPDDWEPLIREKGESWEVSFSLPDGVVGGTPVVYVSKSSGNVIKSFHYQ